MNEPALVLVNPAAAGGRAGALVPALRRWLAEHAPAVRLEVPASAQAARDLAARQDPSLRCILVGGDGTVHQLLPVLLGSRLRLGLVPLGSGNDTARALGLQGQPWQEALRHALTAPARPIDVGYLHTQRDPAHAGEPGARHPPAAGAGEAGSLASSPDPRPFISSLAAGFDAAVGLRALQGPAWLRGLPRYLWATFGELAALRRCHVRVQADGQPVHEGEAIFASVLNTPSYGSGMPAVPDARVDDGQLDVLVAGAFGRLGALRMLPHLLAGTHLGDARIRTRAFMALRVESSQPWELAADGEPAGRACRWEVRVHAGALQAVAAPATQAEPGAAQRARQSQA
ncbi:MAG: diacylglycerol/lipid kinase family protein [Rubrivivax sp.]